MEILSLTSFAFKNDEMIPAKYTCDGDHPISPPLSIRGVPEEAKSLVLIMEDPDIPNVFKKSNGIEAFDHWMLFNIPPETQEIPEGATVGTSGLNSAGKVGYTSPCPPPQYEPSEHRYVFSLYALGEMLHFANPPTARELRDAISLPPVDGPLAEAKLVGRYSRK